MDREVDNLVNVQGPGAGFHAMTGEGPAVGKVMGIVGMFDEPEPLLRAAETARKAGWRRWDCHSPFPVAGLEKAMGLKSSTIPFIGLSAGIFGALFAKTMQWWMSAFDFPLMVGGTPLFALPAFVPVTFELFVLLGALTTFGTLLYMCGLGRWNSPLHRAGVMAEVTSSRFALLLDASDKLFSEPAARRLLEECGCRDIRLIGEGADER
jgi:hypothetical protein